MAGLSDARSGGWGPGLRCTRTRELSHEVRELHPLHRGPRRHRRDPPTHRAYLHGLLERGQLAAAGPFADGRGALFIYEADDIDAARGLAEADPYTLGGVIKQQTITPWTLVYSNPVLLQQPEG